MASEAGDQAPPCDDSTVSHQAHRRPMTHPPVQTSSADAVAGDEPLTGPRPDREARRPTAVRTAQARERDSHAIPPTGSGLPDSPRSSSRFAVSLCPAVQEVCRPPGRIGSCAPGRAPARTRARAPTRRGRAANPVGTGRPGDDRDLGGTSPRPPLEGSGAKGPLEARRPHWGRAQAALSQELGKRPGPLGARATRPVCCEVHGTPNPDGTSTRRRDGTKGAPASQCGTIAPREPGRSPSSRSPSPGSAAAKTEAIIASRPRPSS